MAVADYLAGWAPETAQPDWAGVPDVLNVGTGIDWARLYLDAWDIAQSYGLGQQGLTQQWMGTILQDALARQGLGAQAYGMAQAGEQARMGTGQQLMNELIRLQQDPFNIVTALQAYGATPSATPMAADIEATGGMAEYAQRGMPAPEDIWGYAPPQPSWLDAYMPGAGGAAAGAGAGAARATAGPVDPSHWMLQYGPGEYPADIQAKIAAAQNPAAKQAGYEELRKVVEHIAGGGELGLPKGGGAVSPEYARRQQERVRQRQAELAQYPGGQQPQRGR